MTIANKYNAEIIEHKKYIGGRYSVLSETGMLPAAMMGLNLDKFRNLSKLIKNKNSIIVVEHNIEVIKNSDWIIELGYGAGKDVGKIIFEGTLDNIVKDEKSVIGEYLFKNTQQNLAPNR